MQTLIAGILIIVGLIASLVGIRLCAYYQLKRGYPLAAIGLFLLLVGLVSIIKP